jgi:hypothetical protein
MAVLSTSGGWLWGAFFLSHRQFSDEFTLMIHAFCLIVRSHGNSSVSHEEKPAILVYLTARCILRTIGKKSNVKRNIMELFLDQSDQLAPLTAEPTNGEAPFPSPTRACMVCGQQAWQWNPTTQRYECGGNLVAHEEYAAWSRETFPWLSQS